MKIRLVLNLLSRGVIFRGLAMLVPLFVALFYGEPDLVAFIIGVFACIFAGGIMLFLTRHPKGDLRHREGFLFVTLVWTVFGAMGAIPYRISGYFDSYIDAFFETLSGFTTTGASVLTNIEALPHGLLLWRSLTQWLGGMGIIVLTIAILPFLGVGGMQIFKAESPGPTMDKLTPRITETAKLLWGIYVGITLLEVILLGLGGMGVFDAVCHSLATMATGGFSPRNTSVAYYDSAYIDAVITVFMLIAGTNFALHHAVLNGNVKSYFRNHEFRGYMLIFVLSCVVMIFNAWDSFDGLGEALQYVTFQSASILTTTGFATYDYMLWPVASHMILLGLMLVGGCAGSTAGGMKVMRVSILLKYAHREILKLVHPNAIVSLKWQKKPVSNDIMHAIVGFFVFYIMILIAGSIALGLMGLDLQTSISAVLACMSNIGPGLASVGPTGNFAHIPDAGKLLLSFLMLVGRLEVYTVIVVFAPAFWRR